MKLRYLHLMLAVAGLFASAALAKPSYPENVVKEPTKTPAATSPLDFEVKNIDGQDQKLSQFKGKVVLIVNVASKCGYTPQYKQLEAVYKKFADKGLVVLGFPADNFGHQEPGSNEEIKQFCTSKYEVTFPMMAKISVLGADKAPIYKYLTEKSTAGDFAGDIGWNFNKFIVDRNGAVIARFNSKAKPDDAEVVSVIEKALVAEPAK